MYLIYSQIVHPSPVLLSSPKEIAYTLAVTPLVPDNHQSAFCLCNFAYFGHLGTHTCSQSNVGIQGIIFWYSETQ